MITIWIANCYFLSASANFITREERIMDCPKCKGLMMLERFSDFFLVFYAWKCVNCGAIIDKTICNNRKNSLAAKAAKEAEPASV